MTAAWREALWKSYTQNSARESLGSRDRSAWPVLNGPACSCLHRRYREVENEGPAPQETERTDEKNGFNIFGGATFGLSAEDSTQGT